jgi:hypothetical protein
MHNALLLQPGSVEHMRKHPSTVRQGSLSSKVLYLCRCLQGSDGCGVVEVLLCAWVGAEVVVTRVGHRVRLSSVVSKGNALRESGNTKHRFCGVSMQHV